MYDIIKHRRSRIIKHRRPRPPKIDPQFIKAVEDELAKRLDQNVSISLGISVIAVRVESKLGLGGSQGIISLDWLLHKKRPEEWADILERKIKGEETFGDLSRRAEDVEHLLEQVMASPRHFGKIVLDNIELYDDDFFEALDEVIARDKANLRFDRVPKLELLRKRAARCARLRRG